MKSKLTIIIILFSWAAFIAYVIYGYSRYGSDVLSLFIPKSFSEVFSNTAILELLIASGITGYLINERRKFFKLSEKKLKSAAREWRTTFDSMPYGVMLIDGEFNVIRANKYIADFVGMPIKEIVFNKKCYEIIHRQDKPIEGCLLDISSKTQKTESLEYYDSDRNKYFMTKVTPIFDGEDSAVTYVYLLIDITEMKQKEEKLAQSKNAFFNMLKDLTQTYKELRVVYNDLIVAFSKAIDAKSPWTSGHSNRVAIYAVSIAKELGLKGSDIEILRTEALLHDIGKIGINDVVLNKPSELTDEEFALVKGHPIKGEEILKPIKGLERMLPGIRFHHEKFDRMGYPDGLKGDEIPLSAKILCVADSYDAMVSDRPYRPGFKKDLAKDELKHCSGSHFDPQVVEAFLRVLERN